MTDTARGGVRASHGKPGSSPIHDLRVGAVVDAAHDVLHGRWALLVDGADDFPGEAPDRVIGMVEELAGQNGGEWIAPALPHLRAVLALADERAALAGLHDVFERLGDEHDAQGLHGAAAVLDAAAHLARAFLLAGQRPRRTAVDTVRSRVDRALAALLRCGACLLGCEGLSALELARRFWAAMDRAYPETCAGPDTPEALESMGSLFDPPVELIPTEGAEAMALDMAARLRREMYGDDAPGAASANGEG